MRLEGPIFAPDKGKSRPVTDDGMGSSKLGGERYKVPVALLVVCVLGRERNIERDLAWAGATYGVENAEALSAFDVQGLDIGVQAVAGEPQFFGHLDPLLFGCTK